jgi:RNA polymerase sigma-70 factor (ECF subfamily)
MEVRTEDGYIISKCLSGDQEAFGFLVDKYKASVYGFAYSRILNFHDAEDITQEVFVRAYQKLRTLRSYDRFASWLYSITSRLCKNWLRANSKCPDREFIEYRQEEIWEIISDDSVGYGIDQEMIYEELREELESIPENYRQVLVLYYLSGMNGREIAAFLGTSHGSVRERLYRARLKLKESMLNRMDEAFRERGLPITFTFRILEAVKRIRIHPVPRSAGLPWG